MKKTLPWICTLIAIAGGIFAWWVDSRNDEPQAAVLVILVITFLLGSLAPRKAWLWAILVGACLPGGYLLVQQLGKLPSVPVEPGWYASALAFIPAFIGAYLGALVQVVIKTGLAKS